MFVYSNRLARYLTNERGIEAITTAINPTSRRSFTLFERTDTLAEALIEYSKLSN
ncbi:hypothetical protein LG311_10210 [Sutcliffiella horikoshii]|uniref:hypothetical protein n=1 Tax=Sutcliffiella horikoshii TaxID=79883 RepID=UPI003850B851